MTVKPFQEPSILNAIKLKFVQELFEVDHVFGTVEIFDKDDYENSERRRVGILYKAVEGGWDWIRTRDGVLSATEIAGRLGLSG